MLDDLKYIHHKDASDALGIAAREPSQLVNELEVFGELDHAAIEQVVYAGMGGSALAALIAEVWPGFSKHFITWRNYGLPAFVNNKTLVIVSSYSGNTEEALTALEAAEAKGAHIAIITGGGKLLADAKLHNYKTVIMPNVVEPRFAVFANLKAICEIASSAGLANAEKVHLELKRTAEFLDNASASWRADVSTSGNAAKRLALDAVGTSPVIYAGPLLYPAAYKWKIGFNENAKNVAWCGALPEFNHNEFIGWSSHPVEKPYRVFNLRSSFDRDRIDKRFEITEKLLSGRRPAAINIEAEGATLLQQLLWSVMLGDFVTIYTGLLNGIDPSPVDLVEKLKKELNT